MRKLAEKNVGRVIDLLNERLAFERTGVRLYDRILLRMRLSDDRQMERMIDRMQRFRDEEWEHEKWLEEQIRELHGDDHLPTEKSVLVLAETQGIERVVHRDPRLPHDFHALLTAELADNGGWDLLVRIADEFGDYDAKREFRKRLREEQEHVLFVRRAVERFVKQELLGAPAPLSY
jgi:bacterioferritin (cytochrome b1)